jgi:hypothetical protein
VTSKLLRIDAIKNGANRRIGMTRRSNSFFSPNSSAIGSWSAMTR